MRLRGIHFRPVMSAAGARGFFGEGYPYHRWWKLLGLSFKNCGLVAKTTTLHARAGNMLLGDDGITPREWRPACIVVKPFAGVVLNAVGLSGPGAHALLASGRWQVWTDEPFFLSFMSVQATVDGRLAELKEVVSLLLSARDGFRQPIGLEMNFSCPNAGLDPAALINEAGRALDIAARLAIPVQCKFNATVPVQPVCELARHSACDAITMSNTIPWGMLPERIDWRGLFGSTQSPLAQFGGGGLSGWPLLPIVCDWIRAARDHGCCKPLWACGGVDSCAAVRRVRDAGAHGVQLGVVAMLRPWRMRRLIRCANEIFSV